MVGEFDRKDVIVMKLLHYFITDCGYQPIVLRGASNEIWLENQNSDYKIVRIASNYIHNNEQFDVDMFKTKKIVGSIKRKTLNFSMPMLNIFIDLGDNVNMTSSRGIDCVYIRDEKDINKYDFIYDYFPDIDSKMKFSESGFNLFMKITEDINKKNMAEAARAEDLFAPKVPVVTYLLISINVFIFLIGFLFNRGDFLVNAFAVYGPYIRNGQFYRIITGTFVHVEILHILFNMYALYVVGSQVENFYGRFKYLIIYLASAIGGSLLSITLGGNVASIGASGAIFGLFGSILCFGYYYRAYLGNYVVSNILPVIGINLVFGLLTPGIDNFAHIGGLIGGFLVSRMLGVKYKSSVSDKINGFILFVMYILFLIYMGIFHTL